MHWVILLGPGAWLFLKLQPIVGTVAGQIVAIIAMLAASLAISMPASIVDTASVALSRRIRAQGGSEQREFVNGWSAAPSTVRATRRWLEMLRRQSEAEAPENEAEATATA